MKLSSETLKIIILSGLILMLSCGKKSTNRYGYGNYLNNLPPNVAANLSAYFNTYACPNGRIPEVTFSAAQFYQGSGNTTQIQGQLQPSPIGGSPSNSYVGINLGTKDIIVITKMTSGGRVVGFNISLSLCRDIRQMQVQVPSGYGYQSVTLPIPIIDTTRVPSIGGMSPAIVTDPTNCGMGSVDQAYIILNIPPYRVPNSNATIPGTQLPVSFTRANCL